MKKYYNKFPNHIPNVSDWFTLYHYLECHNLNLTKTYIKLLFILPNGNEEYKINMMFLLNKVNQEIRDSNLIHHKSAKVEIKRLDPSKFEYNVPENKDFKVYRDYEKVLKDIEDNEKL